MRTAEHCHEPTPRSERGLVGTVEREVTMNDLAGSSVLKAKEMPLEPVAAVPEAGEGNVKPGDPMPTEILADNNIVDDLIRYYAAFLSDYRMRMTPGQADRYIGKKHNTVLGAIRRKEIRYHKNGSRYEVTPMALAEWLMKYDRPVEPDPLPG